MTRINYLFKIILVKDIAVFLYGKEDEEEKDSVWRAEIVVGADGGERCCSVSARPGRLGAREKNDDKGQETCWACVMSFGAFLKLVMGEIVSNSLKHRGLKRVCYCWIGTLEWWDDMHILSEDGIISARTLIVSG